MMKLRSIINLGDTLRLAAGVSVRVDDNANITISCAVLREEKNVVTTTKIITGLDNTDALVQTLSSLLPEGTRIHLNVEGRGVLTKVIAADEKVSDPSSLMQKYFPMVDPADFSCQVYSGGNKNFITIARHTALQPFEVLASNFSVVSVSYGVFIASAITPFIGTPDLLMKGYRLSLDQQQIVDVLPLTEEPLTPVTIGGEAVAPAALLAYASAWGLFLRPVSLRYPEISWIHASGDQHEFVKQLYKSSRVVLAVVVITLLINTGFYFWLQSAVTELESIQIQRSDQTEHDTRKHTQQVALRQSYEKIGWTSNKLPVYYADQVGSIIGKDVQLLELEIGVPDKEIVKKEKRNAYLPGTLRVKGIANDPSALHTLVMALENFSWVKEVSDQRYYLDGKMDRGIFEFYIQVR